MPALFAISRRIGAVKSGRPKQHMTIKPLAFNSSNDSQLDFVINNFAQIWNCSA